MSDVKKVPYVAPLHGHMGCNHKVVDLEDNLYPMFASEAMRCNISIDDAVLFHVKEHNGKKYAVNVMAKL